MVEQALQTADRVFIGELYWFSVTKIDENIVQASGRVLPVQAIWGELPGQAIEIGSHTFLTVSGSRMVTPWDELGPSKGTRIPVVLLSVGTGAELEIIHVVHSANEKNMVRQSEDLRLIRGFEARPDSNTLRDELIELVIDRSVTDVVWQYALRRLNGLQNSLEDRFGLVLHPQIQQFAPHPSETPPMIGRGRLEYAIDLLTGVGPTRPADKYRLPSQEEQRAAYRTLLEILEQTRSANMAEAALSSLAGQAARNAGFTEEDWFEFRQRLNAVIENPDHPIHNVPEGSRVSVNHMLESLLGEPKVIAPATGIAPGPQQ